MARFEYEKLIAMVYEKREFLPSELREAVEYLKTQPQVEGFTGLAASVTVRAGEYVLLAEPVLPLNTILGRTPSEVWAMFDVKVQTEISRLENP